MTNHIDPTTILKQFDRLRVDGHTTNLFDIATGYWLTVGDDGECFKRGPRVLRWFLGVQPVEINLHVRAALKTPARRQVHQLNAVTLPILNEFFQHGLDGIGVEYGLRVIRMTNKKLFQLIDRQCLVRAQQCSLEDFFRLNGIHLRFVQYELVSVRSSILSSLQLG